MNTDDLHMILSREAKSLKLFAESGALAYSCEARNRTVNDAGLPNQRWAPCPAGNFLLGQPIRKGTIPFGAFFLALLDYDGHHVMEENHRVGIGIHGGGSGLPHPFAARQGWVVTHGCWRLANENLLWLANRVQHVQELGGKIYVTVAPWTPGPPRPGAADEEPDIVVDERLLDPEE